MNLYAIIIPNGLPNTPKPLPDQSQTFYLFDIFRPICHPSSDQIHCLPKVHFLKSNQYHDPSSLVDHT